jgi:ribosomal protein S18 acetylase RimI-like enzyme
MGNGQKNVVALSINEVREEENRAAGVREGWVRELATRRAWRNKGIATALVCKSMQAFKAAGLDYAGLGVDTENLTGALRIYERLGFVPVRRGINFSKEVS